MFTKLGLVLAVLAPLSFGGLIGQTVTGNLSYGGDNLYDPGNGQVPVGQSKNSGSAMVIIGDDAPAKEFIAQSPNTVLFPSENYFWSANFTNTQLIFEHTVNLGLGENANTHTFTFLNNVIGNVTLAGGNTNAAYQSVSFTPNSITVNFTGVVPIEVDGFGVAIGEFITTFDITETPEPSTLLLGGAGLAGLIAWHRRRQRA